MLQKKISLEQATEIAQEVAIQTAEEAVTRVLVATSKINTKRVLTAGALLTVGHVSDELNLEFISTGATGAGILIGGAELVKFARNVASCKDEDVETFLSEYSTTQTQENE